MPVGRAAKTQFVVIEALNSAAMHWKAKLEGALSEADLIAATHQLLKINATLEKIQARKLKSLRGGQKKKEKKEHVGSVLEGM